MICPKCGFTQDDGEECRRCGIVFARLHVPTEPPAERISTEEPVAQHRGLFGSIYRVFRWVSLISLITVLILILRPSRPPQIVLSPEDAVRAQEKIQEFQEAAREGRPEPLELEEAELNGWLDQNLALNRARDPVSPVFTGESAVSLAKKALAPGESPNPAVEQAKSTVKDVKIELRDDSMRAYVLFEAYGKDVSLELEGRLTIRDGRLRLEPSAGKLGSLPLPQATLERAAARLFDSDANREQFRVSPDIEDIRVEGRQLRIIPR